MQRLINLTDRQDRQAIAFDRRVENGFQIVVVGLGIGMQRSAVMARRERMDDALLPSLREYSSIYGLTAQRASRLAPHALIMHPGPMNRGVEMVIDPAELAGSVILDQVANGVAVRMAVLFRLLGSGSDLKGETT